MKYLCPEINWDNIIAVGFDMDGTLYDEFDFIYQVYKPISTIFSKVCNVPSADILNYMYAKWLEKGSSYPYIFEETLKKFLVHQNVIEKYVGEALNIFRIFVPTLTLSPKIKFILEELSKKYFLFLVSDGGTVLQWNKFASLNLGSYFNRGNVFISGDYKKEMSKPSTASLKYLDVFKNNILPSQILFIGDRNIDEQYATNAGFQFIYIQSLMQKIK